MAAGIAQSVSQSVQRVCYRLCIRGSNTGTSKRFFSKTFRPTLGSSWPPIQWVPGSFPGCKTPEAWRRLTSTPPPSAEVKNVRAATELLAWTRTTLPFVPFAYVKGNTYSLQCHKRSTRSKFSVELLVNRLTCKCPIFRWDWLGFWRVQNNTEIVQTTKPCGPFLILHKFRCRVELTLE